MNTDKRELGEIERRQEMEERENVLEGDKERSDDKEILRKGTEEEETGYCVM